MNPSRCSRWVSIGVVCIGLAAYGQAHASLARNAAGPKNIGDAGVLTIDTAAQLENDGDGKAWTLETGIQYQVTNRIQFLVESILLERLQPDEGESVSGFGDTDVTLSWLAAAGTGALPSAVLGAKVKLPTASNDEVGTGKADYSALFILAKEHGELELNLELEYATFGSPSDEKLKDQLIYTLSGEYGLTGFMAVYTELFGNSAPTASESRTDAALVGVELDHQLSKTAAPYVSFELDTEGVGTARAGVEWTW